MYMLIMIVLLSKSAVGVEYAYYDKEAACQAAAKQFSLHGEKDMKLRAFCIKGYEEPE